MHSQWFLVFLVHCFGSVCGCGVASAILFLGPRAMCEVVKVKIDFHFISPCTWLGGKMGLQWWVASGIGHFCGHEKCSTHCRNLRGMFYEWIFFRIGRTIFPSISWFFFPLLLCLMDGLWLSGFPRLPFGNLEMKIKKRRTILTFFMSIVLEYSNRKR